MRLLIGTPQPIVSGERMTAHMGMFEVKDQVYGFMGISPAAGSDPRSEPVSMTRWRAAPDQAHIRSPLIAAAPISRVRRVGAGGRDHSYRRLLRPAVISVRPPGSGRTDQVRADGVRSSPVPPSSRLPR